jgi:hypothetical protein
MLGWKVDACCSISKIILFYSENALSDGSDDGLDGEKKNPYRFNVHRKLLRV